MESTPNIYLVGLMGAGKTTVGRQLARRLGRRFADSDHEIEERTGVQIPLIFEIEGEAGFRARESQVVEHLTQQRDLVMATGGGVVLDPRNRANLSNTGIVIYLCAQPRQLWERTRHSRNRPLLQVADPLVKLQELFTQRDPLYREIADIVVESGSGAFNHLVKHLEREVRALCTV